MTHNINLKTYAIGFAGCLVLTVLAFALTAKQVGSGLSFMSRPLIVYILLVLAALQFVVQLVFFLHLSLKHEKRWDMAIFVLTVSIVLIIVVGSIWIMNNLNYNMSPEQMNQYSIENG